MKILLIRQKDDVTSFSVSFLLVQILLIFVDRFALPRVHSMHIT